MKIILNENEAHAVLTLVTAQLLDNGELSEKGADTVRAWRSERDMGTDGLEGFTEFLNETVAEQIDEATRRRTMRAGRVEKKTATERAQA